MNIFKDTHHTVVVKINGVIKPKAIVNFSPGEEKSEISIDYPVQQEETRVEHQLEALRWLQGKTSDEFVLAWIQVHKESLERAGGTPERL